MNAESAEAAAIPMIGAGRREDSGAATSALGRGAGFAIASLAAHALFLLALNARPTVPAAPVRTTVTLEIPPPPPTQPVSPPAVVPAPQRARAPATRHPARSRSTPPLAPPPTAAPAPADEPVDMTGVTLTAGDGAGWASPVGDGTAVTGPLVFAHARRVSAPPLRAEAAFVPLANLSRRPEPPELAPNLERLYPAEARRTGTPGEALVSGRVRPDGSLDRLHIVRATQPAFAQACLQLLTGSRWSPPLDRTGTPCATEIRYTCRFQTHD